MANFDDGDGVWRTIQGRRVFIREGQSLGDAMKASGKFKNLKGKGGKVQSKKELFKERLKDITAKKEIDNRESASKEENKYKVTKHEGFGDYNKDNIPVYQNKIDYTGDFGRKANLSSLSNDELKEAIKVQKEELAKANAERLGDQRTRNGKMDKIFNTAKKQKYSEGIKLLEEEQAKRANGKSDLSQGQKESLGSKYRSSLTKLNDKSIEDGTYDLDTGKKVDFGNKGYNVSFEQSSDNYSDSEYFDKIEECRNLCDGKVYGGKFGGAPEISFYTEDKETAMKIMEKYNQHSIYDNSIGDIIENSKYNAATNKVDYKSTKELAPNSGQEKISKDTKVINYNGDYIVTKNGLNKGEFKTQSEAEEYAKSLNNNQTINDAIRAKTGKTTKAFKEDLPKKVEIKEQGTSNRKEVSENIQAYILERFTPDYTGDDSLSPQEAFIRQMDVFDNLPTKWHAGEEMAKSGYYDISYSDQREFLDSLKINPSGKEFSDDKVFKTYTSLIGRESAKLYTRIQRNSYNKYMKEHPASKMSFEEFKNMRKGD